MMSFHTTTPTVYDADPDDLDVSAHDIRAIAAAQQTEAARISQNAARAARAAHALR
jgi:hypothetical protein